MINLNKNYWKILKLREEAPKSRIIEVDNTYYCLNKSSKIGHIKILLEKIGDKASILDIGAGDKYFTKLLDHAGFKGTYKSMDTYRMYKHDFYLLEEITGKYDCITMFELIEHLSINTTIRYIEKAKSLLNQNGVLAISTPNVNHVNQLWRTDITHIQHYPPRDLYALLRLIGFRAEIEIYRIYIRPKRHSNIIKDIIRRRVFPLLNKIVAACLGVDYAQGIMIIAKK